MKFLIAGMFYGTMLLSGCTGTGNIGEGNQKEQSSGAGGKESDEDISQESALEEDVFRGASNLGKNYWFDVSDTELPAELTEDAEYYKICQTAAMEYAILDVSTYALSEKGWNEKQLFEAYPLLEPTGKLFLKREEGAGTWQAQVLNFESILPYKEEGHPGIAFEDEQHGMIMFGWWYTVLMVTEDGGETWNLTESVPKPGNGDHNRADCITNCGESRYLIGYRYLTEPRGSIWLTKDNGGNWEQVTIAIPDTKEKFCYVEPVEFAYDGEVVSLTACMKLEDEKGQRSEVYYETISEDGGETWE